MPTIEPASDQDVTVRRTTNVELGAVIVIVIAVCTFFVNQATRLINIENSIDKNAASDVALKETMREEFKDVMRELDELQDKAGDRWKRNHQRQWRDLFQMLNPDINVPEVSDL